MKEARQLQPVVVPQSPQTLQDPARIMWVPPQAVHDSPKSRSADFSVEGCVATSFCGSETTD
jgi:hypothetical protein